MWKFPNSLLCKPLISQTCICRATTKRNFCRHGYRRCPTSSCVSPCLRRYPVKTSTWVTRCSGSVHRSGGSPEAFIVLQVYCDCPGFGRPHWRSIRLPRGRPSHFPSRLFAWLPSYYPRRGGRGEREKTFVSETVHTCQFERIRNLKSITTDFISRIHFCDNI